MRNEKMYGAMTRLPEGSYFRLRQMALDKRTTFARFARQILEGYLDEQTKKSRSAVGMRAHERS